MNISFNGKRALVTGASRGIGRAVAVALARCGAQVFALGRSKDDLASLCAEQEGITALPCDLRSHEATREAVRSVLPIQLLVNNAAISEGLSFLELTRQGLEDIFAVNVMALVNVSQVVAEDLISREWTGAVVNVSSQASTMALTNHTAYCASKAAVDSITRTMALELGPKGIRVNSINPTVILTDMGRQGWSDPEKAAPMLQRIPLGRFAEVDDVVGVVLFLLSDKAAMVHGTALPVDGGALISGP